MALASEEASLHILLKLKTKEKCLRRKIKFCITNPTLVTLLVEAVTALFPSQLSFCVHGFRFLHGDFQSHCSRAVELPRD